jgi:hypothetical protein
MLQLPNVVGLTLCQQVVTDPTTHNVTLVNVFTRLRCPRFPSPPQPFVVWTTLTDGLGDATISLVVTRLDTLEEITLRRWQMQFSDPLRVIRLTLRIPAFSFAVAGEYQFSLLADGEWVGQTLLHVSS